jgi:hypothetical protein
MKRILLVALTLLTLPLAAAPYHLELEADPAAPFPFLAKFGKINLSVYGGGVRAETMWLNGFSRSGTSTITVMNPLGRMYTDVPIAEIGKTIDRLGSATKKQVATAAPTLAAPLRGKVRGLDAIRYRMVYGPEAWIDVWTTTAIPPNAQLRAIATEFVGGISTASAAVWKQIPGTPVYIELNFSHYKKLPLLRLKSLSADNAGEADALKVGAVYFKAPLLDAIWK